MTLATIEIDLEYLPTIEGPPVAPLALHKQAASNDETTVNSWHEIWVRNAKANHASHGPFKDSSVGQLFGKFARQPVIVAGSGPSLKRNAHHLVNKGDIPLVSCLHNFHFFEDRDIPVDFYVSLDAGEITVEEISEGGRLTHQEYLDRTKDKTLLAFIGTSPKLLEAWQGKVLFFHCPIPHPGIMAEIAAIEEFNTFVSNGGNVLGACAYISKAFLGANPVAFIGADFAFSWDKKFHGWKSKYDAQLGHVIRTLDVFGIKVYTWQSYYNFKCWFDSIACRVPGFWVNCTEGGCFGAYAEGNIKQVIQMPLEAFITSYRMHEQMREQCLNPAGLDKANISILF